mgnify:CR=1 FL=1
MSGVLDFAVVIVGIGGGVVAKLAAVATRRDDRTAVVVGVYDAVGVFGDCVVLFFTAAVFFVLPLGLGEDEVEVAFAV